MATKFEGGGKALVAGPLKIDRIFFSGFPYEATVPPVPFLKVVCQHTFLMNDKFSSQYNFCLWLLFLGKINQKFLFDDNIFTFWDILLLPFLIHFFHVY